MRTLPLVLLISSVALSSACASTRMNDVDRLALYSGHAGAPVKSIRYSTPIGWEKIDDNHLLLTTRPREAWLMRVAGPCLDWGGSAPTIAISSQAGVVSAGFDRISTPETPVSCRIEEIRPVDVAAVRAARDGMASASP
jgi:hypothetical protein